MQLVNYTNYFFFVLADFLVGLVVGFFGGLPTVFP
tara:strand:- start:1393 stop:1497 length:105 start_codon:yes stop_codon:yes gene_type:complete